MVRLVFGCTKRCRDTAPSLPAAMASMTNFGPVMTSPPTKTSGCAVWKVVLSAMAVPPRPVSTLEPSSRPPHSTLWPMAAMTVSAFSVSNWPSSGTGLRRPEASGSPSSMSWSFRAAALPSLPSICAGAARNLNFTPSALASATSSSSAGISASVRR